MPVLPQDAEHRVGHVRVLLRQELAAALDDGHAAAEPAEHLPELEPDVAAAEHEQVLGHLVELHDGGRVERGDPVEPLDVWGGGAAAGVDENEVGRRAPGRPPRPAWGP